MLVLLDTQLLLWAAYRPDRLSADVADLLESPRTSPMFSAVSIWEVAIKSGLGWPDFAIDANVLRRALIEHGYAELVVTSVHAAGVASLEAVHRDPFDGLLVSQARAEGVTLLTADATLARYGAPVRLVQ